MGQGQSAAGGDGGEPQQSPLNMLHDEITSLDGILDGFLRDVEAKTISTAQIGPSLKESQGAVTSLSPKVAEANDPDITRRYQALQAKLDTISRKIVSASGAQERSQLMGNRPGAGAASGGAGRGASGPGSTGGMRSYGGGVGGGAAGGGGATGGGGVYGARSSGAGAAGAAGGPGGPGSTSNADWQTQVQLEAVRQEQTELLVSMVRTVEETRHIGADSLIELQRQGELLERVNDNLRRIHESMDTAEMHISAMQSFFGGRKRKTKGYTPPAHETDLTYMAEVSNGGRRDSFNKVTLRCGTDRVTVQKGSDNIDTWTYTSFNGILVMKNKVLHLSIGKDRRAVRSPQYKEIVATICRRDPYVIQVLFEEGAEIFNVDSIATGDNLFMPPDHKEEIDSKLDQILKVGDKSTTGNALHDQLLDMIDNGLTEIHSQALVMGQELKRQDGLITAATSSAASAEARVHKSNRDMRNLMK